MWFARVFTTFTWIWFSPSFWSLEYLSLLFDNLKVVLRGELGALSRGCFCLSAFPLEGGHTSPYVPLREAAKGVMEEEGDQAAFFRLLWVRFLPGGLVFLITGCRGRGLGRSPFRLPGDFPRGLGTLAGVPILAKSPPIW